MGSTRFGLAPANRPRSIAGPNYARGRTYLHLGTFHPDDPRNVVTGRTIKEGYPFVIQFSSNCLDTGTWYVTSNLMIVSHDYVHPEHVLKINYKGREGDVCVFNKIFQHLRITGFRSAHGGARSQNIAARNPISHAERKRFSNYIEVIRCPECAWLVPHGSCCHWGP